MDKQSLKNRVKETGLDIDGIVSAYCEERNLKFLDRRTSYTTEGVMKMTITIVPKAMPKTCTKEVLHSGLAPIGTRIKCWWDVDGEWFTGTISKASRGSYNVTFDDGDRWRLPYNRIELA